MEYNKIKKLVIDNNEIVYDNTFFDSLKDTSLLEFRKNILMVQLIRPTYYIEQQVLLYYESLLKEFNYDSGLFKIYDIILDDFKCRSFDFLDSYNKFNYFIDRTIKLKLQDFSHYGERVELTYDYLAKMTNLKISEIVIDGLFGDTIYNVWINIKEMLRYHNCLNDNDKFLDEEKIQFYKMILEIDKINCKDKIDLYYKLKTKNISLMFYEDTRKTKDISYKNINNNLFNININLYNYEDSNKYDVPIYDLNGDNFFMLIRCMNDFSSSSKCERKCYSLISSYNMEVFNKRGFIYGYNIVPINNILHIFENDSHSCRGKNSLDFVYNGVVNRIMYPNQIVNFNGWSEIQIKNNNDNNSDLYLSLSPNFLVVFDKIENEHIEEAKRLGIPIVRINTNIYKNNLNKDFEPDICSYEKIYDNYTDGSYMENERIIKRYLYLRK